MSLMLSRCLSISSPALAQRRAPRPRCAVFNSLVKDCTDAARYRVVAVYFMSHNRFSLEGVTTTTTRITNRLYYRERFVAYFSRIIETTNFLN